MAASGRRGQRTRSAKQAAADTDTLLTFPVGVLIRDNDDHVYYMSIAQLAQFRRQDLENVAVRNQMNANPPILGLKNAWRIEGIGVKSGD